MARYEDDWEKEEGMCFLATAAYGTPASEKVDLLRQFRDELLLKTPAGRAFVAVYYKLSPPMAEFISQHQTLRTVVRECCVNPAVVVVKLTKSSWAK
jgi:hypothetical protein